MPMARSREKPRIAVKAKSSCRAFWQALALAAGTGCQNGRCGCCGPRTAARVLAADAAANAAGERAAENVKP